MEEHHQHLIRSETEQMKNKKQSSFKHALLNPHHSADLQTCASYHIMKKILFSLWLHQTMDCRPLNASLLAASPQRNNKMRKQKSNKLPFPAESVCYFQDVTAESRSLQYTRPPAPSPMRIHLCVAPAVGCINNSCREYFV